MCNTNAISPKIGEEETVDLLMVGLRGSFLDGRCFVISFVRSPSPLRNLVESRRWSRG